MPEPRWVDRIVVDAIHLDQIRQHGGRAGLRDENALEVALARPRQKWHYQPHTALVELAAAYAFGLSRGPAYRDGNKQVGFVVMVVFLELNGWRFTATETDVGAAAGRQTPGAMESTFPGTRAAQEFAQPLNKRYGTDEKTDDHDANPDSQQPRLTHRFGEQSDHQRHNANPESDCEPLHD